MKNYIVTVEINDVVLLIDWSRRKLPKKLNGKLRRKKNEI